MEYTFRKGRAGDEKTLHPIYMSYAGKPGCLWDEEYPSEELLRADIDAGLLFVFADENDMPVAADVIESNDSDDINSLKCWATSKDAKNPCAFGRLVVRNDLRGLKLGYKIIIRTMAEAKALGFDYGRFLVWIENAHAIELYDRMGFTRAGKTHFFDADWYCYDMKL